VTCGQSIDAGGPTSATFTLLKDNSALAATFAGIVQGLQIVNCPGNIESPGPWRRNATPDRSSGTLVCALHDGVPTIAWTIDDELLVSAVQAGQHDSALDDLYRWWTAQS
jgi:hypothetical protein